MTPSHVSSDRESTISPGRRPRLLFVVTLAEVGGVASYSTALLPGLVADFEVTVAARGEGPLKDAADGLGIPFVCLRQMRRNLSPVRDLMAIGELYRLMRRERIDILHAHSSKAGVLARIAAALARVPVRIFTVHGWAFAAYSGVSSTVFRLADCAMRPLTTAIIAPAAAVRRQGIDAGTCSEAQTVVVPNAVDTSRYPSRTPEDPPRVLSVGRLAFPKDFQTLLRAATHLTDLSMTVAIAGDGPERANLAAEAKRLGVQETVEFLGTRDDVPDLLAGSAVFALASRSECLPMSIIEAMAAGAAVVASDVGGVSELVDHGTTGLVVPPGDPVALARAIRELLEDPERCQRMGAAGRQRARDEFDVRLLRERHVNLYRRLLEAAGRAT